MKNELRKKIEVASEHETLEAAYNKTTSEVAVVVDNRLREIDPKNAQKNIL
jgi:hypothetical protein